MGINVNTCFIINLINLISFNSRNKIFVKYVLDSLSI